MSAALNAIPGRFGKANPRTWFATVRRDPITVGILFVAIATIAGMWIAVEAKITHTRATKISDVQRENANLARAFEEHTIRTLDYVNEIVLSIQKQYEAKGRRFDLQTFYKEARPNLAVVRNVVITDETGQVVLSTEPAPRLSLADREHIKVHTGVDTQEMFISKPVLGRVNKQFSIIATRRANKPDGSYAGVVGVAIDPGYFSTFYQEVYLGSMGIVTLVGTDGIVRARLARDNTLLGQDVSQAKSFQRLTGTPTVAAVPAETYVSRSGVDNVERIYASRRVRGYPLLVFVGTATNESLAAVTADTHADRVAMSLATVVIGIFAIFLVAFNLRRRRSQAALYASEQRLRTIIETEPECVKVIGANGKLQEMNAAGLAMLEAGSISEVKSHSLLEFILPEYRAAFISLHRRVMSGESGVLEFEVVGLRGTRRWLSTHAAPMRDTEGRVTMLLGITRDITVHKQADGIRKQLAAIVEYSNDAIYSRSLDGTILTWNAGAEKMFGYTAAETSGKNSDFLIPPGRKSGRAKITEGLLGGATVSYETNRLTKDGRVIVVVSSHSPIRDSAGYVIASSVTIQDITSRKQAEQMLREGDQRMRLATETTGVGIWEWNVIINKVRWDSQMFRIYGVSPTHDGYVEYSTWSGAVLPEELREQEDIMQDTIRRRGRSDRKFRIRRANDNKIRYIQAVETVRENDQGQVEWMVGTNLDVTEHQKTEAARSQLAAIVENSNDAIMSRSLEGTILTWNAGAERLLGYTAAEAIGKSSDFLIPANRKSNRAKNTEALLSGAPIPTDTDRMTKDCRVIDVISSHSPIRGVDGEIVGVSMILQDITERKQLQEMRAKLAAVAEGSSDAIILRDIEGKIVFWNKSASRIFGYVPEEVIGKDSDFLVPPELMEKRQQNRKLLKQGVAVSDYETVRRHKDGTLVHVSMSLSVVRGADANIIGTASTVRDITARKQAEAERLALEAQLRESQKMEAIGTLAGGIAHDFNNALAIILGNAELARRNAANNPSVLESVEEIRKAGARVRNLVQQILSFSRRQPAERKPIDLAPVVIEATRLLRATLPARLSLEVHYDETPTVLADASLIEQVLINLATNAMQAMHSGPGRIDIRLDTVTALTGAHLVLEALRARHPGSTVRITVSDTGPGMDAGTKKRIFEPFFTTKPVGEGTGLGLSVVHGIVQGHEGAITVDSEPGKGTTFTVYLPVAEAEASTQPVNPGTEASPPALVLDGGPRILYLDDDESVVFLVERLLKQRGYRVAAHTRQKDALQALRADPAAVDLVLTDYNMPGMSGLDVAREARAIRPDLPVAVTSGFIDEALRAQAEGAGVRELIFKADEVEVFCDAVQRLLQAVQQKTA